MRVFICSDTEFPHKGATSNYIETLAKAFAVKAIDTHIIAVSREQRTIGDWIEYGGICYKALPYDVSDARKTLHARLSIGKEMWNCIHQQGIEPGDVVICYTDNFFFLRKICENAKKHGIKVINCVTEWHTAVQFKYGYLDIFNFWYYCLAFYRGMGLSGKVIVISKKLEEYFKQKGCRVLLMPPLIDCSMAATADIKKTCDKTRFIYSGSFKNKDSMRVILESFASLPAEMQEDIEFHITGYSYDKLYEMSKVSPETWEAVEKLLVVHTWMEYNELIELYGQMDFLLIARETNRATLSNFPSKVPEMMAYGIIPVMTRVGDLPNLYLENGIDSILFEQCTVESCRGAIIQAVRSDETERKQMRDNARKTVKENFAYENWADSIYDFVCR